MKCARYRQVNAKKIFIQNGLVSACSQPFPAGTSLASTEHTIFFFYIFIRFRYVVNDTSD